MPQLIVPFHHGGTNPIKVGIGVGDEDFRLCVYTASSAPLGVEAAIHGWFGRDLTGNVATDKATLEGAFIVTTRDPDWEFMGIGNGGYSPWFDVPTNTQFVVLHTTVTHRGVLILENQLHKTVVCPCGRNHRVGVR